MLVFSLIDVAIHCVYSLIWFGVSVPCNDSAICACLAKIAFWFFMPPLLGQSLIVTMLMDISESLLMRSWFEVSRK